MQKQRTALITSLFILVVFLAPAAQAASSRVYISAVSPAKSGYAVDEAVTINGKIKWEDLTANKTISIQLWNATDTMETLESYTVPYNVSGTLSEDGSYSATWTPTSDLTEKVGSETYYIKIFGTDSLEIDSEAITILVQEDQITMSTVWQDSNNDRVVDVNEDVTYTVNLNWAFIENSESHGLYVDWGDGNELLLTTVSVTSGSGSSTATANHGFSTAGEKTVTFKLKDTTGTVTQSSVVKINVGAATSTTTDVSTQPAGSGSVINMMASNWQYLAIIGAIIVIGYFLVKKD